MLVFWIIIQVVAAIAFFLAIIGIAIALVTREPMIGLIALFLLIIGITAAFFLPLVVAVERTGQETSLITGN